MSERFRAKMRCTESSSAHGEHEVELRAVSSADPEHENARFRAAIPAGVVHLRVAAPEAAHHFLPGHEYYVDFTPASAAPPEQHSAATTKERAGEKG